MLQLGGLAQKSAQLSGSRLLGEIKRGSCYVKKVVNPDKTAIIN